MRSALTAVRSTRHAGRELEPEDASPSSEAKHARAYHRRAGKSTVSREGPIWRCPWTLSEDVWVNDDPWKAQLEALGALLHAQRRAADLSLRELSERTKVSNAYLSQLERGLHEPSLSVLRAIATALGLPLESLLTRAGVLERGEGDAEPCSRETEAAILCDPKLSEPQRTALLSVYRSFVPARPPT